MTCKIHGPGCQRLHVGDTVKVIHGSRHGQVGTIVGETGADFFTVRFSDDELTYSEAELTKVDPIAEYYRRKDAEFAAERQAHLDAGKPISTFVPKTILD